jgi:O-antigen ligase
MFILIFYKKKSIRSIFLKDKIKGLLALILLLTIITYFLNVGNIENVNQINFYNSGIKTNYLYLKMAMNGVFMILTGIFAISIGISYKGKEEAINRIIIFLINLISINALINIIAWSIQTGGVIGRYNFNLPIISSFGVNIQWSILGVILQLSIIKEIRKISLQTIKLAILFLSILIIVSRENQLMLVIILILYLYFSTRKIPKLMVVAFILIIIISFFNYAQSIFNGAFINTYQTMLNPQGEDLLVRYDILVSAFKIFKENIIFGIGYGMFAGYNKVTVAITGVNIYLGSIHNGIISILTEMGIVGLFVNIILAFRIIRRLNIVRKNESKGNHFQNKYIIAIFVFITVNIFLGLISNYFLLPPPSEFSYYGIAFVSWLLIGIVFSWQSKATQVKE